MWKFLEAPDGKVELRMAENGQGHEKETRSLSTMTNFLLLLVGKTWVRLAVHWFTHPPVATVSVNRDLY